MKRRAVYATMCAALLALAIFWWAVESSWTDRPSAETDCELYVRVIMEYALVYARAHGGTLPGSLRVMDSEYGEDLHQLLRCPAAERRGIPASRDGYEYVGSNIHVSRIRDPLTTPIVFDKAGNHKDHTRSVAFVNTAAGRYDEVQFRALLLRAVLAGDYPQTTVEELKVEEPWLAKEMHTGK